MCETNKTREQTDDKYNAGHRDRGIADWGIRRSGEGVYGTGIEAATGQTAESGGGVNDCGDISGAIAVNYRNGTRGARWE